MKRERILDIAVAALALCGIASTVMVAVRFHERTKEAADARKPTIVSDWRKYSSAGHWQGDVRAPVTIVTFTDFQCPACRAGEALIDSVEQSYAGRVAVVFRHLPLPYHREAYDAARAAECADAQGRFTEMRRLLYAHQDSLGVKPWLSFARDAGIGDTSSFDKCVRGHQREPAIETDRAAAKMLGAHGTPTYLVGKYQITGVPSREELDRYIQEMLHSTAGGS